MNKARQIGISTTISLEATHKAAVSILLKKAYRANFVSINQKEASDKVEIARNLYHSIPREVGEPLRPKLWTDSETEISFHRPPDTSTIISQPSTAAIRGGSKDIYLDEFAHVRDAKKIYTAALPAILRGDTRITIVSTPLGQSGKFYDIATDTFSYPNYSRHVIPWWEANVFVKEGYFEDALAEAPLLLTQERVMKYGNEKLILTYQGYGDDITSFQTEMECMFVDETEAYFPWEMIIDCRHDDMPVMTEWPESFVPKGQLAIGLDLAKERDKSVFTVSEIIEDEEETHRWVRMVHATQESYEDQFAYLKNLIDATKPSRVTIDQTGVGQVFTERIRNERFSFGGEVNIEGVVFTNQKKEKWATTLKGEMQSKRVHLLPSNDLLRQIHGIRRTKTEANFYRFAGKQDDYFWSMVLSFYGGSDRRPVRFSILGS